MALKRIKEYKDQIEFFMNDLDNEDYLKFFNNESYHRKFETESDDWSEIQRVSIVNEKPVAFFTASINRDSSSVTSLSLVNISKKPNYIATKDMFCFLDYLLKKKKYHKISFSCFIGNPAEKIYDRVIKKYNGRIVGTRLRHNKLSDGCYYDLKMYEVLNDK